jgi:hypothetical protein
MGMMAEREDLIQNFKFKISKDNAKNINYRFLAHGSKHVGGAGCRIFCYFPQREAKGYAEHH